jgi:hypothetical protein
MGIDARHNLALVAVVLGACAGAPTATPPSALGECAELRSSIAATDEARRAALETQQGAWKAVIPVLVAARYALGQAEVAQADGRRAELQRGLEQRGCVEG